MDNQINIRLAITINFTQGMTFLPAELQSKWIAQALSGKVLLPSEKEMLHDVEQVYRQMEERGIPKSYTHSLNHQVSFPISLIHLRCYSFILLFLLLVMLTPLS